MPEQHPTQDTLRYALLREYANPRELHSELRDAGKIPGYKWTPMRIDDEDDVGEVIAERVDELLDWAIEAETPEED